MKLNSLTFSIWHFPTPRRKDKSTIQDRVQYIHSDFITKLNNYFLIYWLTPAKMQKKKEKHMEKVYTIEYQNIKKILLQPLHYLFHSWSIKDYITSQVHILSLKMKSGKSSKSWFIHMKDFCNLIPPCPSIPSHNGMI